MFQPGVFLLYAVWAVHMMAKEGSTHSDKNSPFIITLRQGAANANLPLLLASASFDHTVNPSSEGLGRFNLGLGTPSVRSTFHDKNHQFVSCNYQQICSVESLKNLLVKGDRKQNEG